jgi:hypothetical protein
LAANDHRSSPFDKLPMTAAALVSAFRVRSDEPANAMVVKLKLPRSSPAHFVDGFYQNAQGPHIRAATCCSTDLPDQWSAPN